LTSPHRRARCRMSESLLIFQSGNDREGRSEEMKRTGPDFMTLELVSQTPEARSEMIINFVLAEFSLKAAQFRIGVDYHQLYAGDLC